MINGRCPATMCCIALVLGIVGTPIWEAIANDVIGSKELVQTPQWLILGGHTASGMSYKTVASVRTARVVIKRWLNVFC